jgi:hypothetical protein
MIPSDKEAARFERGFKTWAENTAIAIRTRLQLSSFDPLNYATLGRHLGVLFWELADIDELPRESRQYLSSAIGSDWSAITVTGERTVIVVNPSHSEGRRSSSGMHELAHVIRGHTPSQVTITPGGLTLRSYDARQEAEADWLAGCLLLPRPALEHVVRRRIEVSRVCADYKVSNDLYVYRLRITGVERQYGDRKPPMQPRQASKPT